MITQSSELSAVLAQMGVDIPAPTFWQGLTTAPIQLNATFAAAQALAAGDEVTIADSTTGQRIATADASSRWRGIVTGVNVLVTPGDGTANGLADAQNILYSTEVRLNGSGGELRVPTLAANRVAPGASGTAGPYANGCSNGGGGVYNLSRAYWLDTETTETLRFLEAVTVNNAQQVSVLLYGIFAMNTKSRNDTYKDVPGVDPTGRDCAPSAQFMRQIAHIVEKQGQSSLLSALQQGK